MIASPPKALHTALLFSLLIVGSAWTLTPSFNSAEPPPANFRIDNGTNCSYTVTVYHSTACPPQVVPTVTSLSLPANGSVSTTLGPAVVTQITVVETQNSCLVATWNCTSNTTGTWTQNGNCCALVGNPTRYARVQGDGYLTNKIDWQ